MWKVPMLKQCCCGCSLKQGSIIIGALGILHGIATIIEAVFLQCTSCPATFKLNFGSVAEEEEALVVTGSVLGSLLIVLGIALIVGSAMELRRVLLAWLLSRGLVALAAALLVPVSVGLRATSGVRDLLFTAQALLVSGIAEIGLDIYFLLVVYSFYRIIAGNEPTPEDL